MSHISNALKRIQRSRQNEQTADASFSDGEQIVSPNNASMLIFAACILMVVLISLTIIILAMMYTGSRQNEILSLEKTAKIQEMKINELSILINKTKTVSDSQIRDLKSALKKRANDVQAQINNLASNEKDNYDSIKVALFDDKNEMDSLDSDIKQMDQKIKIISASMDQAKNITSPSTGN